MRGGGPPTAWQTSSVLDHIVKWLALTTDSELAAAVQPSNSKIEARVFELEGVAWDVGLAAEREDGRSLAVLAATDTD